MELPLIKQPLLDPVDIDSSVLLLFIFRGLERERERERQTDREKNHLRPLEPFIKPCVLLKTLPERKRSIHSAARRCQPRRFAARDRDPCGACATTLQGGATYKRQGRMSGDQLTLVICCKQSWESKGPIPPMPCLPQEIRDY